MQESDLYLHTDALIDEVSKCFVHPTASVDPLAVIGINSKIWHYSRVMAGAVLGEACSLGQNVVVHDGVRLGANCKIQNNVSLYSGLEADDDVFIGPSAVFTNIRNPRSAFPRKDQYLKTRIGTGATIGANATVLCGVNLGAYCFVGAGAVLTSDVKPYALVVGVPARQIGWMSRAGQRLNFPLRCATGEVHRASCPETGDSYTFDAIKGVVLG